MKTVLYIVIGILLVLVILSILGKKSVHHEITIDASSQKVWQVLMDMESYPEWNTVMLLIGGEVKQGSHVKYRFTQDENTVSEIGAKVIQITPYQLLNQKGGIPMILTFNHKYILENRAKTTKVTIHEDYSGLWVNFWNPSPVEEAYKRLNMALKERTESLRIQ